MNFLGIVYKNILRRKARTFLSLLGIMIGVSAIVALVGVSNGLRSSAFDVMGNLTGDISVTTSGTFFTVEPMDESVIDEIRDIKGVKYVAPVVIIFDIEAMTGGGQGPSSFEVYGIDPVAEKLIGTSATDVKVGRELRVGDRYKMIVGSMYAKMEDLKVGSKVMFYDEQFEIVGIMETGNFIMDQMRAIPIDIAREVAEIDPNIIHMVRVKVEKPGTEKEVALRINLIVPNIEATTSSEQTEQISEFLDMIQTMTWAISAIAAIVGGIGIMNTMLMSVIERTKEIGVFKAVGWSNNDVLKMILLEGFLLGLFGGILGIGGGKLTTIAFASFLRGFQADITLVLVGEAMLFAVSLGVFGGIYPAYKAASIDPIDALRNE
ncbi:MAG: ABC transporter permease [Methanomicrobia archaeon]|nr:ABC transporter permease [Methanomicrobia archaeon]